MSHRWYVVHVYSVSRKRSPNRCASRPRKKAGRVLFGNPGSDRGGRRGSPRRQGQYRAQILSRLCADPHGADRRKLAFGQDDRQGHGFLGGGGKPAPISEAEAQRILHQVQEGIDHPSRRSISRSASRFASSMAPLPPSTARWKKWTRTRRGSKSRFRSSAAPRRSSWNIPGRARRLAISSQDRYQKPKLRRSYGVGNPRT